MKNETSREIKLPMQVGFLNSLHMEYQHRFAAEFQALLQNLTFAEVFFRNHEPLTSEVEASYRATLDHFFDSSFRSMALGLSRVWDERRDDPNLISIPNLVSIFSAYSFLGCRGLTPGNHDRSLFETLFNDPIRMKLRVVRTEAFAHSIMFGTSKDRRKLDLHNQRNFNIVNRDAIGYCRQTLALLLSLIDQLTHSASWRQNKSLEELTKDWDDHHVAFLKHFCEVQ